MTMLLRERADREVDAGGKDNSVMPSAISPVMEVSIGRAREGQRR